MSQTKRTAWYPGAVAIIVCFIVIGLPLIKACENRQELDKTLRNPPTISVQEDEPGWDCRTMGNKRCT